jgi:hypothetical protein
MTYKNVIPQDIWNQYVMSLTKEYGFLQYMQLIYLIKIH